MCNIGQMSKPLNIAVLIHERVLATSITLPLEIIEAAAQTHSPGSRRKLNVSMLSSSGGNVDVGHGVSLATRPIDNDTAQDLVIVPAIWRNPRWVLNHHPDHCHYIAAQAENGAMICSVGTGSFLIAETGLLDGRETTTHWQWTAEFKKRFSKVTLRSDQLITASRPIYCCGSVNSVADLMVYLCGELYSTEVAQAVEHQFSPEIRQTFSPSELAGITENHGDETVMAIQQELRARFRENLSIPAMAKKHDLSTRTLNRRFQVASGTSPTQYIAALRLQEARTLLHKTNLPIGEVSLVVGFTDASRFAGQFKDAFGMTPRAYRQAVRGKRFALAPEKSA